MSDEHPNAYRLIAHEVRHHPGGRCATCSGRSFTLIRLADTGDEWQCPACCPSWRAVDHGR